jgi:hypothetical protein
VRAISVECIQHRDRVSDERRHRARFRRLVALTVATVVDRDDTELGRERRDVPAPRRDRVAGPLEDHERRSIAIAGQLIVDPAAVRAGERRQAELS